VSAAAAGQAAGWPPPLARVRILVSDHGVGMSAQELAVVQEGRPFAQVGKGQLQGNGGTGLGLTIVRAILAMHNDSQLRLQTQGHWTDTDFELELRLPHAPPPEDAAGGAAGPLGPSPRHTVGSRTPAARPPPRLPPLAGPPEPGAAHMKVVHVLHVEDDEMLRLTLGARLFHRPRVVCAQAADGAMALTAVEERARRGLAPFDLVLMDNQMPGVSGTAATRRLRAMGFRGVVVGMTGDPVGSPDRNEFEAAGLTACVDKTPEGMAAVQRQVDALLDGTGALSSVQQRPGHYCNEPGSAGRA